MRGYSPFRAFGLVAFSLGVASAWAIVPDEQFVPKATLREVVRIYSGNDFYGTGSVIDKIKEQRDAQGNLIGYYMPILTVNHVIKDATNLNVRFNNPGNAHEGPYTAWVVAEGKNKTFGSSQNPEHPDLAILGIKTGRSDFLDALTGLRVLEDTDVNTGTRFTVSGFGDTGTLTDINGDGVPDGYRQRSDLPPNKRFANNIFDEKMKDRYRDTSNNFEYVHQSWQYDLTGPIPGVDGEGYGLSGDSGAPMLIQDPTDIPIITQYPRTIRAFTNGIIGLHTRRAASADPGWNPWGRNAFGVRITPDYRTWIYNEAQNVPEPGSIVALTVGALLALSRKRRRTG